MSCGCGTSTRSRSSAWPCSSSSGRTTSTGCWRDTTTEAPLRYDATSSGWTRQPRSEYRQTTVQEPWGDKAPRSLYPFSGLNGSNSGSIRGGSLWLKTSASFTTAPLSLAIAICAIDLPPVMGPLLVREFSGWAPWNQSSFPAVSRRMTSVTAWSATTVRKRAFSSSRALSRFR